MLSILFYISIIAIATFFIAYPLLLLLRSKFFKKNYLSLLNLKNETKLPTITGIVTIRNGGTLVDKKIENCFNLLYPDEKLNFIFVSDGSNDDTNYRLKKYSENSKVKVYINNSHMGKIECLNFAVKKSNADILLFTDVDAILFPEALKLLIPHFFQTTVGGVCGRRLIGERQKRLRSAQDSYFRLHNSLQILESKLGSVTATEGKLYAIRRELFQPIIESVTDDLFTCLSVVKQGFQFKYEPEAIAQVHLPSRSLHHEIVRRRRIVSTSLRGVWHHRCLLNPFRYKFFAADLFVNKVLKRFLPFFLVLLFFSNIFLLHNWFYVCIFSFQLIFYGLVPLYFFLNIIDFHIPLLSRISSTITYFCFGNAGTLLGVIDFLLGKKINLWEPLKQSQPTDN